MGAFVNPKKVVEELSVSPGMHVADIGCGSGHYVFAVAEKLQGKGRVYAVDIQKKLLDKIFSEAEEMGINTIDVLKGDAEEESGTHLGNDSIDLVILSNILFQVDKKENLARECARILKSGGRVAVLDWTDSFGGLGPPAEYVVPKEEVLKIFEENGLSFSQEINPGAHHYMLVFEK